MGAISMGRAVVPFIALVAGGGVAFMLAVPRIQQERPTSTATVNQESVVAAAPATDAHDRGAPAVSAAQSAAGKLAATLAAQPPAPGSDQLPEFDIVRIEPGGEAVIAGRATPGATVELLRNGEPYDRVVADQSGQFAMIPRPLPPGNYDLTLRVRQGDGRDVVSKQSVAVALEPKVLEPKANEPPIAELTGSLPAHNPTSSRAAAPVATQPQLAAIDAIMVPDKPSPSPVAMPKIATTTVSRGDSLWRISQRALGAGQRYTVIYHTNKAQIRNPNLIYPGQMFVMPAR